MTTLLFIAVAYLLGSLSFAVIVSRAMRLPDPRSFGSGNPGATNVLRTGRKSAAILTLLGDALKGWVAVVLARTLAPQFGLGDEEATRAADLASCARDLPELAAVASADLLYRELPFAIPIDGVLTTGRIDLAYRDILIILCNANFAIKKLTH